MPRGENKMEVVNQWFIVSDMNGNAKYKTFHEAYLGAIAMSIDEPNEIVEIERYCVYTNGLSKIDKNFKPYLFVNGKYTPNAYNA